MWNMRRNINPEPMPRRRSTIQIIYWDLPPARRNWWLIVEPGRRSSPDAPSIPASTSISM